MDPNYTIDEGAVIQHEMFTSWVKAGFTRAEALELLKETMRNASLCPTCRREQPNADS